MHAISGKINPVLSKPFVGFINNKQMFRLETEGKKKPLKLIGHSHSERTSQLYTALQTFYIHRHVNINHLY